MLSFFNNLMKGRRRMLHKIENVLREFEVYRNEFDWDEKSLQEAEEIINNKLNINISNMSQFDIIHKLKEKGLYLVHNVSRNHALSNGAIIEFER